MDAQSCDPMDWPARLLCPWNFPGKNTGVSCHFLLLILSIFNCVSSHSCIPPPLHASPHLCPNILLDLLSPWGSLGFPGGSVVKNPPFSAGDAGSIPGPGRSPGGGNGNLLQYSCLENPKDRGAWRATVHSVAESGHD